MNPYSQKINSTKIIIKMKWLQIKTTCIVFMTKMHISKAP